jgi:hypothetical protein
MMSSIQYSVDSVKRNTFRSSMILLDDVIGIWVREGRGDALVIGLVVITRDLLLVHPCYSTMNCA